MPRAPEKIDRKIIIRDGEKTQVIVNGEEILDEKQIAEIVDDAVGSYAFSFEVPEPRIPPHPMLHAEMERLRELGPEMRRMEKSLRKMRPEMERAAKMHSEKEMEHARLQMEHAREQMERAREEMQKAREELLRARTERN